MSSVNHLADGKVQISTLRLLLRPAQDGDAISMNVPFSDPDVMRYWSELPHKNQARTDVWVQKMIEGTANGTTDFIICLKPDLIPIGKVGVWHGQEIGFLLARSHWRKGLATEALRSVLSYMFEEKGYQELVADIDPRNAASRELLQKMGFEQYDFKENTFEIGGEWVDSVYVRLTKERFAEQARRRT